MIDIERLKQTITEIVAKDVTTLLEKEKTYQGSWKKRGGVGAFMMLARKWDRIENMCRENDWDIFESDSADLSGADGTLLAEIRDLRAYLILVESELKSTPITRLGSSSYNTQAEIGVGSHGKDT